jgi:hypothetical protein
VKLGYCNNWVVVADRGMLPFYTRLVALPVLAALAVEDGPAKPDLARDTLDVLAERFAGRSPCHQGACCQLLRLKSAKLLAGGVWRAGFFFRRRPSDLRLEVC